MMRNTVVGATEFFIRYGAGIYLNYDVNLNWGKIESGNIQLSIQSVEGWKILSARCESEKVTRIDN